MKRMIVVLAVVVCAGCTASTTMTSETAPAGDLATFRKLADDFDAAAGARNLEQVMAFYAEDAVFMPPNVPTMTGRTAIRQFWTGLMAAPSVDLNLTAEDVQTCDDMAVERGRYEVTTPFKDSGKYLIMWRHRGGRWLIVNDIFNSSLSPAP